MGVNISITNAMLIGENDHGYRFGVGQIGERWIGFAASDVGLFFFPGIAEDYLLGLLDRALVIKLTGAIARDVEQGYGGIARWFVPEELRGNPEDFRCENCQQVACDKQCYEYDFWEEEP